VRAISRLPLKGFALLFCLLLLGCGSSPVVESESPAAAGSSGAGINAYMENPEPLDLEPSAPSQERPYFDWPVDSARLSRGYLINRRRPHLGLDLASRKGTQIFASHDGLVIYTGNEFRGYGKMIMIEGINGFATLYAHLSQISVRQGTRVKQGELIGLMGRTGHATGTHLHFEIRVGNKTVNPLHYLPK
jgi:murein DD-endopeptidase MepM/ murein hydrolase activator NlpD